MRKKSLLFLLLLNFFYVNISFCQSLSGIRVGGGFGKTIYIGSQMDLNFTSNAYGKSEFGNAYNIQVYKAIDKRNEFGIRYLNTELWSFKNSNTFALNSKLTEVAFIYQRSLNKNIEMDSKSKFTFNTVLGLGYLNYSSTIYTINEKNDFIPFSSVGDGFQPVSNPNYLIREKKPTVSFLFGFNIGYRISSNFSVFYEGTYSLSANNNFSGNLSSVNQRFLSNGFSYNALSLYLNLVSKKGRLRCPRF